MKRYRQASEAGVKPVTLGKRILRTETAGLAVLSVLNVSDGELTKRRNYMEVYFDNSATTKVLDAGDGYCDEGDDGGLWKSVRKARKGNGGGTVCRRGCGRSLQVH